MEDSSLQAHGIKEWRCDQCPAAFGRLNHLKRHTVTHNTEKGHVCQFCGAVFGRGDVLRRHWKSCKSRIENDQDIPEIQRGGKHKRACDSCASLRKACNGETPCAECRNRARQCTYQRLHEDDDSQVSTQMERGNSSLAFDHPGRMEDTGIHPSWDLGLQTYFPTAETRKRVYAERKKFGM